VSLIDLSGKVVLITGGSRGIGAATALLFARAGADVAFTYRSRRADAEKVLAALRAVRPGVEVEGGGGEGPFHAYQAELSSREANQRVVADVVRDFGGLDYFVANAGIWPPDDTPLVRMSRCR
jgi:3-oxoacyl-[acyl-carrier protein] reductase